MTTREAQLRLTNHGHYPGRVDGKDGPKTQKAIKAFQTRLGLKPTGKLTDATMVGLRSTFPKVRINAEALRRMGVDEALAVDRAAQYDPLFQQHGINTVLRMAHFLGQVMHESRRFEAVEENLNYTTPERICKVWPSRFLTVDSARPFVGNPVGLANFVYNGRMGNRMGTDDGWNNRGRGDIHTTGANNYRELFTWLGLPADTDPGLVATKYAAASAVFYWTRHGLNTYAAADEYETLTRRINGGTHGLQDRIKLTERAKEVLCRTMYPEIASEPVQQPEKPTSHLQAVAKPPALRVENSKVTSRWTIGKPGA